MPYFLILFMLLGCAAPKKPQEADTMQEAKLTNFLGTGREPGYDAYEILPNDIEYIKSINSNIDMYNLEEAGGLEDAFEKAIQSGDYHTITNILIQTGSPMFFDRTDHFVHTMSLSTAAFYNQQELVDFFLALGYDPAIRSGDGIDYCDAFQSQPWTAIEAAAAGGHTVLLQYLIDKKLPESKEQKSEPLFWAALENQAAAIEYIIKNNIAAVNSQEAQKALRAAMGLEAAAWFLSKIPQPEAARKLLELRVKPSTQSIHEVFASHDLPTLKLLESFYPKLIDNSFHITEIKPSADSKGLKDMFIYLKDKGLDLSGRDVSGRNIFFILAQKSDPENPRIRIELIQWLIGQGLSIHTVATNPKTKQELSAIDALISHFQNQAEMKFYLSFKPQHHWSPQLSELLVANYIEDAADFFYQSEEDFKTNFSYFEKIGVLLSPHQEFSKGFNPIDIIHSCNTDPIYANETGLSSYLKTAMIRYFEEKGWASSQSLL